MLRIALDRLPWPPRTLSPNDRSHWSARAKAAKVQRKAYAAIARESMCGWPCRPSWLDGDLQVAADFHVPSMRKYDADNLLASIKAGLDGVCDVFGIDDARFKRIQIERYISAKEDFRGKRVGFVVLEFTGIT